MNSEPIHWKPRNESCWGPRVELAETLPEIATHVAHHFGSREPAPNGRALGGETSDPLEDDGAGCWIKQRRHELSSR